MVLTKEYIPPLFISMFLCLTRLSLLKFSIVNIGIGILFLEFIDLDVEKFLRLQGVSIDVFLVCLNI